MSSDFLQAFLRAGMFIALVSLVLILTLPGNSAEFVVSICSLLMGLILIGFVVVVTRLANR
jgi:hypothetical protein